MKNAWIIAGLVACSPIAVIAESVPLYTETDGQLAFTGDYLDDAQLTELLGGAKSFDTFGPPNFVARDERNGTIQPVWADLTDYEIVHDGDGVVEDRHDDLVFDEGDANNNQEDLVFDESEAEDLREDLDFSESDATETGDDMTFAANESLSIPNIFSGTQPDFLQPAHGIWSIELSRSEAIGCPPGIAELASAQLGQTETKDTIFSEPGWVPADLNSDYGRYSWTPVGTNGFQSEPYTTRPQANGSGVSLAVIMALNAQSERQIDVWAQIQMDLAPALAAIAGGTTKCVATIEGSYTKN